MLDREQQREAARLEAEARAAEQAQIAEVQTTWTTGKGAREWKAKFVEALSQIPNVRYAADAAGVSRQRAYRERHRDEAFALAWADAHEQGLDLIERIAHTRATAGQTITKTMTRRMADGSTEVTTTEERHLSDSLLMFLLKRYRPEFRETFKVTGADGGPVKHEVTLVDEAVTDFYAELDRLHVSGDNGA